MTRWQAARKQWSQPTADIHALRRALGRKRYNQFRQKLAAWRRAQLIELLEEEGLYCGQTPDLTGVGTRARYRIYWQRTGGSRVTFYRDLAAIRRLYERHHPDGPTAGTCACTAVGRSTLSQSAQPAPSGRAWDWLCRYAALRLALEQALPAEMAEAVRIHAARILEQLRPPRRLGDPAPGGHRRAAPSPPSPAAHGLEAGAVPAHRGRPPAPVPDDPPDAETFVWRA